MKKLLMSIVLLSLTACSKVTLDNYDRLEMGMAYEDVTSVLGSPDKCEEKFGTNGCVWGDESNKYIKVNFIADKAVFFEKQGLNDR